MFLRVMSQCAGGKSSARVHTLVFAVATLNFLMGIFLHITLQNSRSSRLVELCRFENMGSIYPIIVPPPHHMLFQVISELKFVHGDLHTWR